MPQHAADYIKTLISQRKASDPTFAVQKMCDDLNLPKSTIDKFLARQTVDTSWINVSLMVAYLGGSLDYLAGIQRAAAQEEAANVTQIAPETISAKSSATEKSGAKPSASDASVLSMIAESHEKEILRNSEHYQSEIDRINAQHNDYMERFRRLTEENRSAMLQQHSAAYSSLSASCKEALDQQKSHLDGAIRGRNFWRITALCLMVVLCVSVIGCSIYAVWEFSNPYAGLTGIMLSRAGLIPEILP